MKMSALSIRSVEHTSELQSLRHLVCRLLFEKNKECVALFCFIGAVPATSWLDGTCALDEKGFILTDRLLPADALVDPLFSGREPLPFETSSPRAFAVRD